MTLNALRANVGFIIVATSMSRIAQFNRRWHGVTSCQNVEPTTIELQPDRVTTRDDGPAAASPLVDSSGAFVSEQSACPTCLSNPWATTAVALAYVGTLHAVESQPSSSPAAMKLATTTRTSVTRHQVWWHPTRIRTGRRCPLAPVWHLHALNRASSATPRAHERCSITRTSVLMHWGNLRVLISDTSMGE